ncbi:uncharacterized protein [Malus domestica]|uniref:uncharacterized protein isoform X4 n=1 Tax=Malus domestica TaxID=3750 RepID=UPI0039766AB6
MKFALVAEWLPSLTSTTASLFAFPLSPNRILIFEQGNSKLENLAIDAKPKARMATREYTCQSYILKLGWGGYCG